MKRKLSLVLIVLLGVLLLSGCSNDSNSLSDEAAVLNTVEALEEDLDSLAINYFDAEVTGDWTNDNDFNFVFSGVDTNIDDLDLFKNIFIIAAESMKIDSVEFSVKSPVIISSNKAQVNADLLISEPSASSSGIEYDIIIDLSRKEGNWFIDSFEIRINDEELLSQEPVDVYGDESLKIYYPVGDSWVEPASDGFSDGGIKLNSSYYKTDQNFRVVSSVPKYSTLVVDKGSLNTDNINSLSELEDIINQKTEYEDEIKTLSENLLVSLYGGDINITVKIDALVIENVELLEDNRLLSDVKVDLSPNIDAPDYNVNINDKINLSYKIKIIYKLDSSSSNLYLAAYAAPELYYNDNFAEDLINSFEVIEK